MGNLKNIQNVTNLLDSSVVRIEGVSLRHFQSAVWALFCELVYTTPQFTGRAAANWNIGLGAPDYSVDYGLGEQEAQESAKDGHIYHQLTARKVGDNKWAEEAKARNKYKVRKILTNTKVFISNAVQGDNDEHGPMGEQSSYYLAALQDASYWATKLRAANDGAKMVEDVLLSESWRGRMRLKGDANNQEFIQ